MAIVKFGDIVRDVKINVDRANNPYEHYVAGDHMDSEDLTIHRYGSFETDDVGPAFTRIFKPGQILYGSRRTYLKKVAVADFEGICANTTFVLESKDEALFDNRLLPFIMLSDAFTRWSIAHSKGSTNPYVLFSDLADYEFDLPPIAEQKVLADKLWAAYRLKESYKKLLAATDEMVKSQFIEMFGECQRKEKLSSLCETFIDGDWIESKDQSEDGIRLVQTGNVGYGYFKDKEDKSRYISEETFNRLHCTEIFAGDILVSRLPDPIGRACIIPEGIGRMITAVDCSIIRLKDVILPEYFISYTMTSTYSAQINEVTTGTTRRRVSRANLGNVLVPCPSLEAQRQFVAISQQADKSKFVGLKSQFIEMFGNPVTNPKGWKTSKIKDVAPESPSKESVDGRVWLLNLDMIESNTGKVIEKVYEDSENALSVQPFDEGNVLFSKLRPYLNKVVIPDEPGLATTELVPLRPKGDILNKIFFSHLLRGDQFVNFANDIAGGTKMPRMPLSELRKFECILPPIEEQMKFVAIAELADKSKYYYQIA